MAYNLLKGKRGIISGALNDQSIAWKIAERAAAEGATFTLTNAPLAMRMGEIDKLAADCNSKVIGADATSVEDLEKLYTESQEFLGGKIDFVLHSIGMSTNIRKNKPYNDLNYEWFLKSLDVSALSFHKMMQVGDKLDALAANSSIVGLSYMLHNVASLTIPIWPKPKPCWNQLHVALVTIWVRKTEHV
jgi:enoyl-[acyl-carrier protein] reductase I